MLLLQAHERARVSALASYGILGSDREAAFEELVAIACRRFAAPISAISFVDERRWWPKAIRGFARRSLPRSITFCDAALDADADLLEIPDAGSDERFAGSPLVASGPHLRYYAGVPLRDRLGYALGTFAILDARPRRLAAADAELLRELARVALRLVELRGAAHALGDRAARRQRPTRPEPELRAITESARDGIVTLARDGTIVYANPAARAMFGHQDLRGRHIGELIAGLTLDGDWTGAPVERWATGRSGARFPVELSCTAWPAERSGRVTAIVRDVSERFAIQAEADSAQRRLGFLLRATSELLEQPLATDALLAAVARLMLPQLGDVSIVDLVEGDKRLRRMACAPGCVDKAAAIETSAAFAPVGDSLVAQVLRSGQPLLCSPSADDAPARRARDLATAYLWARTGWRACLLVPLIARNRTVGAITLVGFARGYGADELALAQELGHRVALAVDTVNLYDQARAAVRVRDEVLAIVSHDLRNPLSTILTSTSHVLKLTATGAPARAPLERCRRAARLMKHMISDLVDAASLEAGTLSLDQRENELDRVVLDALDLLAPLAEARGLALTTERPGSGLRVLCDRDRIAQVLSNLIGNAIKFTPARGTIRIVCEPYGDMVRVAVTDDGPGIAAEKLPRIFDRYWHQPTRESRQGSGLGLYIAKGIIENHGGRIWVDSIPGRGSAFYFTLPSAAPMEHSVSN